MSDQSERDAATTRAMKRVCDVLVGLEAGPALAALGFAANCIIQLHKTREARMRAATEFSQLLLNLAERGEPH